MHRALDGKKRDITWRLKESLKDMEYADEICLVSYKYERMQKKLDDLQEESKKVGLQINPLRTEEIRVNTIINRVFKLNGEEIKKSPDFCYLGSVVAEDGGSKSDVLLISVGLPVANALDVLQPCGLLYYP